MIQMTHYNDGKEKHQSHAIGFSDNGKGEEYTQTKDFENGFIIGHDITSIQAYGESKEEALENLKEIMEWLNEEYKAIYGLYKSGVYQESMIEVDCFGKPIKN